MHCDRGSEAALQSERSRVCLQLPIDLQALQSAISVGDGTLLSTLAPLQWLAGFRVEGFDGFFEWADALGVKLRSDWRKAAELAIKTEARLALPAPWVEELRAKLSVLDPQSGTRLRSTVARA